jgi:hypothetical protein
MDRNYFLRVEKDNKAFRLDGRSGFMIQNTRRDFSDFRVIITVRQVRNDRRRLLCRVDVVNINIKQGKTVQGANWQYNNWCLQHTIRKHG